MLHTELFCRLVYMKEVNIQCPRVPKEYSEGKRSLFYHVQAFLELLGSAGETALELGSLDLVLLGHNETTSLALVVVVGSLEGIHESLELGDVLLVDLSDGEDGSSLLVNKVAETSLALDNAEGNVHLAAQGGEPDDELDGVNIVGDDNELGSTRLNKVGHVVETVLDGLGLGGSSGGLTSSLGSGGGLEAVHLLLLGLRAVSSEELEKVGSCRK